jgi:antitoxin component of MazEF toxin-antitoxin module
MSTVVLRRWHGGLIFTVPNTFVLENNLVAGSAMYCTVFEHDTLVLRPVRKQLTLDELIADTPADARVPGWSS